MERQTLTLNSYYSSCIHRSQIFHKYGLLNPCASQALPHSLQVACWKQKTIFQVCSFMVTQVANQLISTQSPLQISF